MSSRDLASLAIDLSPNPARLALAAVLAIGLFAAFQLPVLWFYLVAVLLVIASALQA